MKKILLLIVVVSLVVFPCSGCKNNDAGETEAPSPSLIDNAKVMNIYNFSIEKETEVPSFTNLIFNRYGLEIKFHEIGETSETDIIANLDGLLFKVAGTIFFDSLRDKKDKYYILNDFLEENEIFNMLPKQYRKSLEDENGDIWSFPTSQNLSLIRRIYNESIMDENNLATPSNVDEFIELLETVKEMYSDDEDFTLLKITPDKCLFQLKDILEYCGLTVNDYSRSGIISWNEKRQRFEDSIYNLDADLLFDLIDYMRTNSLYTIVDSDLDSDLSIWNGNVFTELTSTNQKNKYMSEPFYDHKEYIFNRTVREIFVPLGTTNPKDTINLFINTFFGSNEGNIYGFYGESGRTVTYDDSFTQVNLLPPDKRILNGDGTVYSIMLVGPGLYNDYSVYSETRDVDSNEKLIKERLEYQKLLLDKLSTDEIEVLATYKNLQIRGIRPDHTSYSEDEALFRDML